METIMEERYRLGLYEHRHEGTYEVRNCANPRCKAEIRECMGSCKGGDMELITLWYKDTSPNRGPMPHIRELCGRCSLVYYWGYNDTLIDSRKEAQ